MRTVIILADLDPHQKTASPFGVRIIKVFSNLKKAYEYIYTELGDYPKVSYSSVAGYLAKGSDRYFKLDNRLAILKMSVE